jgi:nitrite reductase/ring-hydroxylating ferredoxin subunit
MDLIRVAERAELLGGERRVIAHGDHEVLVLALNDCIYAVGNICTHDEVWLDDGILHPDSCEIECPMHEGRFDLRTGAATHEPAEDPVPTYPVRIVGDEVFIEVA